MRERAILKRVLLGYARWNKSVGYCQGFNILAAVLLQVLNNSEEKALKVCLSTYGLCFLTLSTVS